MSDPFSSTILLMADLPGPSLEMFEVSNSSSAASASSPVTSISRREVTSKSPAR